jgi:enterobactin synthetase component F
MQARGLEVEMLAMIDSYVFAGDELARPRNEAEEVRAVMSFLDSKPLHENTPQTLKELAAVVVQTYNPHSIPLFQEIIRNNPEFIYNLCAVMLNHLALARQYVPGKIDVDLLYFQAMDKKGDLDGILDRSPAAWRQFIGGRIEVHELACHHEGVLDPVPAAQIGNILRQRFSMPRLQRAPLASSSMRSETGEMSVA